MDTVRFSYQLKILDELIRDSAPAYDIARAAGFKNNQELANACGLSHQNTLANWRKLSPLKYRTTVLGAAAANTLDGAV